LSLIKECSDLGRHLVHALPEKRETFAQITIDGSTSNLCQLVGWSAGHLHGVVE